MDTTQYVIATFVIIGLVNGIKLALSGDWAGFIKFLSATTAGAIFGYLQWFNLPDTEIGLAVGIAASGVYKMVQMASPQPQNETPQTPVLQ